MDIETLIKERQTIQERRGRFLGLLADLKIHGHFVVTDELEAKGALKRFRASMQSLDLRCKRYSDSHDNQAEIAADVEQVKVMVSTLLEIDPRLSWTAGNVTKACDAFLGVLNAPEQRRNQRPPEPQSPNPRRIVLLDQLDELGIRLTSLGNVQEGGLSERKAVVAKLDALRREVSSSMAADLDGEQTVNVLREIEASVRELANIRSSLTEEPGFMLRSMPSIVDQINRIVSILGAGLARPSRTLIPVASRGY